MRAAAVVTVIQQKETTMRTCLLSVLIVVFVAACGSSPVSPLSPTPPSSTGPSTATAPATDLRIAGADVVLTGYSIKYDATATLSNGATIYHAQTTWNTSDPSIATINSEGVLTGQKPGAATITGTYRGATAAVSIRVSPKPLSRPSPAKANLVLSYAPDPVPGSPTPCPGFRDGPSWRYVPAIAETGGVGFNLTVFIWNLYDEGGSLTFFENEPAEEYFAANSVVVGEEVCISGSIGGRPNGAVEDILNGVDDNGNQVTFARRRQLLPVNGVSPTSRSLPVAPMPFGLVVRTAYGRGAS
jgi:hypothetical protein